MSRLVIREVRQESSETCRPVGPLRRPPRSAGILSLLLATLWLALGLGKGLAADASVRIWPVGDSITEGCCLAIGGGYRTELYQLLTGAGYYVDFVGSLQDINPPSTLLDPDHDGHAGYRIDEIDAGLDGWASLIDDPDVVLLHIGTNDAAQNYNMATAPNRLQNLITHIATLFPYAKVIVASLIVAADPSVESRVETYNSAVPGVVSSEVAQGLQVSFVNMHACCGVSDLSDPVHGLHPNETGYAKMATNWFPAIASVVSPLGTANPPVLVRVQGELDLKHVEVTFSKPVDDVTSTDPSNYVLSDGVAVLGATLDSSKRIVTLTTSPQAVSTSYTLTVSGVTDRTPQQHAIAPGSSASFVSKAIAEAANYSLVYSLHLPNQGGYNTAGVPYEVDNHATLGPFSRVAYYLELQPINGPLQYVWVSMSAFTQDASKIGVPTIQSGAFFQQLVSNMNVRSSVPGVVTGDGMPGGNIEFWWGNYGKGNGINVPNASGTLYDWGDSASPADPAGYGSMQVHNWGASQTVFAFNGWGEGSDPPDLGIGNYPGKYPDWTLAANAVTYSSKLLQVYAIPIRTLTVASSNPGSGVGIRLAPRDENGFGNGLTTLTRTYELGTEVSLGAPVMASGNTFQKWQRDGVDFSSNPRLTMTIDGDHNLTAFYVPTRTLTVNSSNPATGVTVRLAPTDNNGQGDGAASFSRLYADGKTISLAAPLKAGGNSFKKWQKDGVDYSTNYRISVTLRSNITLTAVYEP